MKKIILVLIISIFCISCFEDLDTIKKENLFIFYEEMKEEILKENIDWIEKNFKNSKEEKLTENIKSILIENNDSIKNLISSENGEYSATINFIIGENSRNNRGYFIIRNTAYSPTYYYIRLVNENSAKWEIESIDKLPLNNR
ncbi:hypothetical protein [Brachyspira sp.]|uniref:hypothetical protein n=1 Tax=Brachyspira sp. TaxID=1977261 RepID=UPI003D7CDCC3